MQWVYYMYVNALECKCTCMSRKHVDILVMEYLLATYGLIHCYGAFGRHCPKYMQPISYMYVLH